MPQAAGSDIVVALYDETTYGTDPGSPVGRKCYVNSVGLNSQQELLDSPIITGGRGKRKPALGNIAVAGQIVTTLAPETLGFWLKHALGAPTTTGAGPYIHTFRPTILPVGFVVEKDWTAVIASKVERFNGCRIASLALAFPQQGYCTATMQIIGQKYSINAAVLDATLDDPGHGAWTGFSGIVKVAGTQIGVCTALNVSIDNEMPGGPYCFPASGGAAGLRRHNREGQAKITGSIRVAVEDLALLTSAMAATDTTFEAVLTFGTGAGTAGNEQVSVLVDHSLIKPNSPALDTAAGIELELPFTAFASGATDKGVLITLKNAIAAASL